jgi:hypothetical protein
VVGHQTLIRAGFGLALVIVARYIG